MRRFVFVLMFSLTAPEGRWVASSMCTPSVRPRCATLTSADRKSGNSFAIVANSSMTTSRRGSGSVGFSARYSCRLSALTLRSSRSRYWISASSASSARSPKRLVEVGDHADRVRQARALVERRAALEVHEDERQVLGIGVHRQPGDEAAQELALARARRPADEAVRPVADHVEVEGAALGDAQRGDRTGVAPRRAPALAHRLGVDAVELEQRQQPHAVGQPRADELELGVVEAREVARARARGVDRQPGEQDVADLAALLGAADRGVAGGGRDLDHRVARGRQAVARRGDDDPRHGDRLLRLKARRPRARLDAGVQQVARGRVLALGEHVGVQHDERRADAGARRQGAQHVV